ncbi:MAG: 2-oxo acid dehydrogenase subunit E2, partial [Myxococcales bacterium]|nr:2-oxo acid dehydrogenase subunit E2 [Myxococcales bacterium]
SPSVRKLARETDVDLQGVSGTGDGGRITHDDVRAAAKPATPPPAPAAAPAAPVAAPAPRATGAFKPPPYLPAAGDEIVPFTRRRRIIADHMVYSKHTSPEVVTFAECDLNKTHLLREKSKRQYEKEGYSLTFLAFVVAATARALREHPELNSRVLDDAFVKLRNVNLGIAVDTPDGLVVPVIKNA